MWYHFWPVKELETKSMYFLFLMRQQINFLMFPIFLILTLFNKIVKIVKYSFTLVFVDFGERGRERERNMDLLLHLLMHALVASCLSFFLFFHWLILARALTGEGTQPGRTSTTLGPTQQPSQGE